MITLIDEYGDTDILQPPYAEKRRDSNGNYLGPRGNDERSYCERQIAPKDDESLIDIAGSLIDGP